MQNCSLVLPAQRYHSHYFMFMSTQDHRYGPSGHWSFVVESCNMRLIEWVKSLGQLVFQSRDKTYKIRWLPGMRCFARCGGSFVSFLLSFFSCIHMWSGDFFSKHSLVKSACLYLSWNSILWCWTGAFPRRQNQCSTSSQVMKRLKWMEGYLGEVCLHNFFSRSIYFLLTSVPWPWKQKWKPAEEQAVKWYSWKTGLPFVPWATDMVWLELEWLTLWVQNKIPVLYF